MMRLKFTVYENPFGKQRPRVNKRSGQIYTPKETVMFERTVENACMEAMKERDMVMLAPDQPVAIRITAYYAIPASWSKRKRESAAAGFIPVTTKPDADNIAKIIMDACNEVVYPDDKQVDWIWVRKLYSTEPRVEVELVADHGLAGFAGIDSRLP